MEPRCSDIDAGVLLASRLYQYGFLEEGATGPCCLSAGHCDCPLTCLINTTDVLYKNLQNDILNLRFLLEKQHEALQSARPGYVDRRGTLGVGPYDPLSEDFEKERRRFVGDFLATLNDCDTVLEQNKKIRRRYNNDVEHLSRRLGQQEQRVASLRSRLNLHAEKSRYVLDRLSNVSSTELEDREETILTVAERNLEASSEILPDLEGHIAGRRSLLRSSSGVANAVPRTIAKRFEESILINAQSRVSAEVPLGPGIDALLSSFQQSNIGLDQTHERYLLFLKTCWLLDRLKASEEYQTALPGYYYRYTVNCIEHRVLAKIQQPGELIPYEESALLKLPDLMFRIWPPSTPTVATQRSQPHLLMARANEQKVASIKLASNGMTDVDTVTVFRSSNEHYRLVVETVVGARDGARCFISQTIYSSEDRLVPRYALPTLINPSPEMAVFSRNEETLYTFDSFQDLHSFQTALTGYDVAHDQGGIRFQFSDEVAFLDGFGRLQLWQEPITQSSATDGASEHHVSLRTPNSFVAPSQSHRHSLIPSIAPTNTVSWTVGGWEAECIKLPAIVIYTQLTDKKKGSRFAIVYLDLDPGIYVDAAECGCCQEYEKCSKLVLTKHKKPDFTVRVHYSDIAPTGQPDANTFNIFPFRLPRNPAYRRLTVRQTKYLVLKFRSLPEKQQFHRELNLRFRVRDKQIADQRDFARSIHHRQDRPQDRRSSMSQSRPLSPSGSVFSFGASLPPILDVPDAGPALTKAFADGTRSTHSRYRPHDSVLSAASTNTRPISSTMTADTVPTSLDSVVESPSDVSQRERPMQQVSISETASLSDARENYDAQEDISAAYRKDKDFHRAHASRTLSGVARNPSSIAPERYNPETSRSKRNEAPTYHLISPTSIPPRQLIEPMTIDKPHENEIHEAPDSNAVSPRFYSRPAAGFERFGPDFGTLDEDQARSGRLGYVHEGMAPIGVEHPHVQAELITLRAKSGNPKSSFLARLLQK